MTLFIADFGGSLGFFLGVSILSVVEILEGLLLSALRMFRDREDIRRAHVEQVKTLRIKSLDEDSVEDKNDLSVNVVERHM